MNRESIGGAIVLLESLVPWEWGSQGRFGSFQKKPSELGSPALQSLSRVLPHTRML